MNAFQQRYNRLNVQQKQAVDTVVGPVLVLAGPGSGKTELLSVRIAKILETQDIGPHNILAVSFTEAAAKNLRLRLIGMIGEAGAKVAIHTFHSLGREIISRYPEHFFGGADFQPLDDLGRVEIIEPLLRKLPFDHPFSYYHPEQGFTYLKDALARISQLKRAGLTPEEFIHITEQSQSFLEQVDPLLVEAFEPRLNASRIAVIQQLSESLKEIPSLPSPVPQLQSSAQELLFSLQNAIDEAEKSGKAASLSAWKQSRFAKDDDSARHLKELTNIPKLLALGELYGQYQTELYNQAVYDFDDMLLETIIGIERVPALKETLQEQYQFILVDEFQDTNDAQMRLLYALTDATVNEGRPNVLAVGDDDQAVYRFQGAEVTNLLKFLSWYRQPEIITLESNYRSGQPILDVASKLIMHSVSRITDLLPGIEKKLVAAGSNPDTARIINAVLPNKAQELAYIANSIRNDALSGTPYEKIAVIARTHRGLTELLPYLAELQIAVRYEREQDVLRLPMVQELLNIARFVVTLSRANVLEADYLLPGILAAPCWNLSSEHIWRLSLEAGHRPWLPIMREHTNPRLRELASFFIELSRRSLIDPLADMLSLMIGAPFQASQEDENGEGIGTQTAEMYRSPFHAHYFGIECLEARPDEYIRFLAALQTLTQALYAYQRDTELRLSDLLTFVELHERNGITLTDTTPYGSSTNAVRLLTAHGAKGLEFTSVYILDAEENIWLGRGKTNKIPLPAIVAAAPAADNEDDYLRLLFVALTRAERQLTLTRAAFAEGNKASIPIASLEHLEVNEVVLPALISSIESSLFIAPFDRLSKVLLADLLSEYVLTATDLNSFLDVTRCGPAVFVTERLLRFPQPRSVAASYGSAIHTALNRAHITYRITGKHPSIKDVIATFEQTLIRSRLDERDARVSIERGTHDLALSYPAFRSSWKISDLTEFDLRSKSVCIAGTPVTGKIDILMRSNNGEGWIIGDYKTGHPVNNWTTGTQDVQKKMYTYRRQLLFYTLLIEEVPELVGQLNVASTELLFVEPERSGAISRLSFIPETPELERTRHLIAAVYACIQAGRFPDVTQYSDNLQGIIAFEEALLTGKYKSEERIS